MTDARFVRNPAFLAELAHSAGVIAHLATATGVVAAAVRAIAPDETGYYKRRVKARGTRVVAEDFGWHWVEFGSSNNPPYAPLRRGIRAAGLRLDVSAKP